MLGFRCERIEDAVWRSVHDHCLPVSKNGDFLFSQEDMAGRQNGWDSPVGRGIHHYSPIAS